MNLKQFITEVLEEYVDIDFRDSITHSFDERRDITIGTIKNKYPNLTISNDPEGNYCIWKLGRNKYDFGRIGDARDNPIIFIGTKEQMEKEYNEKYSNK